MHEDDSFDDMPKLIRYGPSRTERPQKPDIKPIDVVEANRQDNQLAAILKKPTTSEMVTPAAAQKKQKEFDMTDKELSKLEKALTIEKVPRSAANDQKVPSSPQKNIDKSKTLITQMVNKISAKNVAEELLPISLENITKMTRELDAEKAELAEKASNIEQQLRANPHNKNLQKELYVLEKGMERFDTMKLLYLDKVELRNENRRLLGIIEELKKENKEIKAKIAQGIQQIEAHMHNLPCDKEKALEIEIRKCQEELKSEREMRTNLEKSISSTIQNFARLYEQADLARKIVVSQLKEIEEIKLRARHDQPDGNQQEEPQQDGMVRKRQDTKIRRREDSMADHPPSASNRSQDDHTNNRTALKPTHQRSSNSTAQMELPQQPTRSNGELDSNTQRTYRKHERQTVQRNAQQLPTKSPQEIPTSLPSGSLEDNVKRMRANQEKFR